MKISLVMITKNEEINLPESLTSVKDLADEIIIVDSGSTDNTVKIAEKFNAKVFYRNFDSFSNQKNYALSLAKNNWVLHLDADEVLSEQLKNEIKNTPDNTPYDGFYLIRTNSFLMRQMKHAGLGREIRLRLAKKSLSKYIGGIIHEELVVDGRTGYMKEIFYHHTCRTLDNYFIKFDKYTTFGAVKMYDNNKNFHMTDLAFRPVIEFLKRYIMRLGFLDGKEGFVWAVLGMYYSFIKYVKLWQLIKTKKKNQ
ncbi:MAG: glycosyltransferase family 2 protein [Endomicrobiaceae bacterium]